MKNNFPFWLLVACCVVLGLVAGCVVDRWKFLDFILEYAP